MSKQDRQGVRNANDLEQKYNFGKSFAEVMGIAKDAQTTASQAKEEAGNANNKLTPDEIFGLLTNNGQNQGIYKGENGEIYVNASYIKSGLLIADLVRSGKIVSEDGTMELNLDNNYFSCDDPEINTSLTISKGFLVVYDVNDDTYRERAWIGRFQNRITGDTYYGFEVNSPNAETINISARVDGVRLSAPSYDDPGEQLDLRVRWKSNGDGTYSLIGF